MRSLHRPVGVLAGASLLLAGLALPAHADTSPAPTRQFFLVSDQNDDGYLGLYKADTIGGPTTAIVAESEQGSVDEVSGSADGSRIVTVEESYSDTGFTSRVVVRDVSGQLVRVLSTLDLPFPDETDPDFEIPFDIYARLSPDGTRAVWTHEDGSEVTLQTALVAGGPATTIPGSTDLVISSFLDADTIIATSIADSSVVTFPVSGTSAEAPANPVVNAPSDTADFVVSPDRSKVAFRVDRDPSGETGLSRIDLLVAPLTLDAGVATLGPAVAVTDTLNNGTPVWVNDSTLDFIRDDGEGGKGDVFTVPADGSSPAALVAATDADEIGLAAGFVDSAAPPAPTADVPFALRGTAATIAWTAAAAAPTTTDLSGYVVTRTAPGGAVTTLPFVPAPVTRVNDSGLTLGQTYTYAITARDRSGNASAAVTRQMTALSAAPTFASPTSANTTTASFPVTFGAGDPASTVFSVDYRTNGGAFASWINHTAAGVTRYFGGPAAPGVAATSSTLGSTYVFRVTAFDGFGNATLAVTSQPAVVPYDETRAKYSGGYGSGRYSDAWYHSVRVLKTKGGYAVVTLPGHRFQVLVTRCPTCGVVEVVYGGRVLARVDTYARTKLPRQVVATVTWTSDASRTLTVRTANTVGRPNVYVDGFTMWR